MNSHRIKRQILIPIALVLFVLTIVSIFLSDIIVLLGMPPSHRLFTTQALIALFFGLLLFCFFWFYLGRIENRLMLQEEKFRKKQEELEQSNKQLQLEILERKHSEEAQQTLTNALGKRLKELDCLYGVSDLVEKPDLSLVELFQETIKLLCCSWQYPEVSCARIVYSDQEFTTQNFKETEWKIDETIVVHGKEVGILEICYLEERPESDEGPFLAEERYLIKAVADRLKNIIESKLAEEALKKAHDNMESGIRERTIELKKANELLEQEVADRKEVEDRLREREKCLQKQSKVLVELATRRALHRGDLNAALQEITKVSSETLGVERVGVWLFSSDRLKIFSIVLYEHGKEAYSVGQELKSENFPSYFKALEVQNIIAVHDAQTETATRELFESYLLPLGITSLLVAPVRSGGQSEGVICHEHVGPARHWTTEEQVFASSIADFVALALTAHERKEAEAALQKYRYHLEEIVKERTSELARAYEKLQEEIVQRKQATEIAAVMEERGRLARELHDSVSQSLYSLTLFAETSKQLAENGDLEGVKTCVDELKQSSQGVLKELRLLVYDLRPSALEEEGLVGALRQRLEAVERRSGVKGRLVVEQEKELPPTVEEGLYRIAQEALNNALKHSRATEVLLRLSIGEELVELEVADNGIGFDLEKVIAKGGGMGLTNMRERAEKLGGSLKIQTAPDNGAAIDVRISI